MSNKDQSTKPVDEIEKLANKHADAIIEADWRDNPNRNDIITDFKAGYAASTVKGEAKVSEWQLCPKCDGKGFYYSQHATTTSVTEQCDVCNGAKILVKPIIS